MLGPGMDTFDLDCTRALDSGAPLAMVLIAGRPLVVVEGGGLRWVDPRTGPVELALAPPVATAADGAALAGVHPAKPRAIRVVDGGLRPVRDVYLGFEACAVAIGARGRPVVAASARGEIEVEGVARWSLGTSAIERLALAPDGAHVAGADGAGVFAASLDGSGVARLDAGRPSAMAWSTAHGLWAFVDGAGLFRLDVDAGTTSDLELEGWTERTRAYAFSPDGTRVLVSDGAETWVADTGRGRRLCRVRTEPGARLLAGALDADETVGWALFERGGEHRLARFDQA